MSVAAPPPSSTKPDRRDSPAPERPKTRRTSLFAHGEPQVWLTGGALAVSLFMIVGLLVLVFVQGVSTFWPGPVVRVVTADGMVRMGEVTRDETYFPAEDALEDADDESKRRLAAAGGESERRLFRTENFELTNTHFHWVSDFLVREESEPEWALVFERIAKGRFYGFPKALLVDGEPVATEPEAVWNAFQEHHADVREHWGEARELREVDVGIVNGREERARLDLREVELDHGRDSPEYREEEERFRRVEAKAKEEFAALTGRIDEIERDCDRYQIVVTTADGAEKSIPLAHVVRAYAANRLGFFDKLGVYLSRWWEFLTSDPREANSEGGVWPAIFGTVVMTLIMCILVVPFGVLAALYLREYAKGGPVVSAVRIAINNLAGVPSIVYGVFGLGFFCYILGAGIDGLFYRAQLPNPTYGKGGLMWAAFTLALLTLPVVIVATEEALAAVPGSMREGSYGCGASKWQTIRRIVLPRAMPGIMTGTILAMARGAGEVAPLMLVGAVKLAPHLPVELTDMSGSLGPIPLGPVHPDRSFMHLGFHIFDLGFQSQNSEAAKPMVFTTTLLLITIVVLLNVASIWIRGRLRRKFGTGQF